MGHTEYTENFDTIIAPTILRDKKTEKYAGTNRNEICPCGSGKKYKHCHGK